MLLLMNSLFNVQLCPEYIVNLTFFKGKRLTKLHTILTLSISVHCQLTSILLIGVNDLSCFPHRSALCHVHQQNHFHVLKHVAANCHVETTPASWSAMLSLALVTISRYSIACSEGFSIDYCKPKQLSHNGHKEYITQYTT